MTATIKAANLDPKTVSGFGDEWSRFTQSTLESAERERIFNAYFKMFPWERLPKNACGADIGCGSGRWAKLVAPRVGMLHLVDASSQALAVAKFNLSGAENIQFHHASVDAIPIADHSLDFAYSLGVLHHLPDTQGAIVSIANKLKPGALLLVYMYYALETKPTWYRWLWRASNLPRLLVCRLPHPVRFTVSEFLALFIYWPLARIARLAEKRGFDISSFPLSAYRYNSFYTMRTDALDRFGTRLEKRFTRDQIQRMLEDAGFMDIRFSSDVPYWCAVGIKS